MLDQIETKVKNYERSVLEKNRSPIDIEPLALHKLRAARRSDAQKQIAFHSELETQAIQNSRMWLAMMHHVMRLSYERVLSLNTDPPTVS